MTLQVGDYIPPKGKRLVSGAKCTLMSLLVGMTAPALHSEVSDNSSNSFKRPFQSSNTREGGNDDESKYNGRGFWKDLGPRHSSTAQEGGVQRVAGFSSERRVVLPQQIEIDPAAQPSDRSEARYDVDQTMGYIIPHCPAPVHLEEMVFKPIVVSSKYPLPNLRFVSSTEARPDNQIESPKDSDQPDVQVKLGVYVDQGRTWDAFEALVPNWPQQTNGQEASESHPYPWTSSSTDEPDSESHKERQQSPDGSYSSLVEHVKVVKSSTHGMKSVAFPLSESDKVAADDSPSQTNIPLASPEGPRKRIMSGLTDATTFSSGSSTLVDSRSEAGPKIKWDQGRPTEPSSDRQGKSMQTSPAISNSQLSTDRAFPQYTVLSDITPFPIIAKITYVFDNDAATLEQTRARIIKEAQILRDLQAKSECASEIPIAPRFYGLWDTATTRDGHMYVMILEDVGPSIAQRWEDVEEESK